MERFEAFTGYMLQFNRYIQKIKEIEMQQFGLHAMHTMCLYYLNKNRQGLTSGQLTQLCREDKAAISRCLKQLTSLKSVRTEAFCTSRMKEKSLQKEWKKECSMYCLSSERALKMSRGKCCMKRWKSL